MEPQTFIQKILAKRSGNERVAVNQIVTVKPDHLLTHDNTSAIFKKVEKELLEYGVVRKDLNIIVLDHVAPASSSKVAQGHKYIRKMVNELGIKNFYDVGNGVCHQLVVEKGYALPGKLIVGSDSHTCMYGALNCFSTGIDRTEAACLSLTGELWLKVPETIKITIKGDGFNKGVYAKDLVLTIIGKIGAGGANYKFVEYHLENPRCLNMSERFTITNMAIEMGAKGAAFKFDEVTKEYIENDIVWHDGASKEYETFWADEGAKYHSEIVIDLKDITPTIANPHAVDNTVPIDFYKGKKHMIDECFIGTCTNGRIEDYEVVAEILKGNKVAKNVRLLIGPSSRDVLRKCILRGYIDTFLEAGAVILPPGCGPCLGAHNGVLAPGERALSTSNRNFKGRMGEKESEIYLGSPATAAYTAIKGYIADPREFFEK